MKYVLFLLCWLIGSALCDAAEDGVSNTPHMIEQDVSLSKTSKPNSAVPTIIQLPKPDSMGLSVEEALKQRKSIRNFSDKPITLQQLSLILYAAQGITHTKFGHKFRSAPSAGALYPIEVYIVAERIKDITPGLYHYLPEKHQLHLKQHGELLSALSDEALSQQAIAESACSIILTAVPSRTTNKYGRRGHRYIHIEAGHISQNIYLQVTSLKLGSVAIGAFRDVLLKEFLGIKKDNEEYPIYIHAVGIPR